MNGISLFPFRLSQLLKQKLNFFTGCLWFQVIFLPDAENFDPNLQEKTVLLQ